MKQVEKWLWRYRWGGRNVKGTVLMSEDQVRREHPDAVRIEGTRQLVEEPETPEELREALRRTDTSAVRKPHV